MKLHIYFFVFVLCFISINTLIKAQSTYQERKDNAHKAYINGLYDTAIDLYKVCQDEMSSDTEVKNLLQKSQQCRPLKKQAEEFFIAHNYSQCKNTYEKIIAINQLDKNANERIRACRIHLLRSFYIGLGQMAISDPTFSNYDTKFTHPTLLLSYNFPTLVNSNLRIGFLGSFNNSTFQRHITYDSTARGFVPSIDTTLVDKRLKVSVLARLYYNFIPADNETFELYSGISTGFIYRRYVSNLPKEGTYEKTILTYPYYTLGIIGGGKFMFSNHAGLFIELGYPLFESQQPKFQTKNMFEFIQGGILFKLGS